MRVNIGYINSTKGISSNRMPHVAYPASISGTLGDTGMYRHTTALIFNRQNYFNFAKRTVSRRLKIFRQGWFSRPHSPLSFIVDDTLSVTQSYRTLSSLQTAPRIPNHR